MGLDLYAKIESMLGFEKEVNKLYDIFISVISKNVPKNARILDVGCGSGIFALKLKSLGYEVVGIDLSAAMVKRANEAGLEAYCISVEDFQENNFDAITAVFDVLNYIEPKNMQGFLSAISTKLKNGGLFFADINSLVGFSEVAPGVLSVTKNNETAIVDAEFDGQKLITNFTLFTPAEKGLYKKENALIAQYFYDKNVFANINDLKLIKSQNVRLFSDSADKVLLSFTKA